MAVLMSILTWDQIEAFRSGRDAAYSPYIPWFSRKLFEPEHFPDAKVLKFFDKHFGKLDDRDIREVRIFPILFPLINRQKDLFLVECVLLEYFSIILKIIDSTDKICSKMYKFEIKIHFMILEKHWLDYIAKAYL